MTCEKAVEWMQRSLDQQLDDSEREAMLAHISWCKDCAEMYTRLQQLSHELSNLPRVMPPVSLVDAILPQLDEIDRQRAGTVQRDVEVEGQTSAALHSAAGRPRNRFRWAFPFSAVGGVIAAGVVLALFMTNQTGSVEKTASESALLDREIATSRTAPASSASSSQGSSLGEPPETSGSQAKAAAGGSSPAGAPTSTPAGTPSSTPGAMLNQEQGAAAPSATPLPLMTGSGSSFLLVPNPSAGFPPAEDKSEGVSISEAGRPFGMTDPGTEFSPMANSGGANASEAAGSAGAADPAGAAAAANSADTSAADTFRSTAGTTAGASAAPPDANGTPGAGSAVNPVAPEAAGTVSGSGGGAKAADPAGSMLKAQEPSPGASAKPGPDSWTSMGLLAAPPAIRLLSPDEQLVAVYDRGSHRMTVAKASDGSAVLFSSEHIWSDQDTVELNGWLSGSIVSYTVTRGETKWTYVIDVENKQERLEPSSK